MVEPGEQQTGEKMKINRCRKREKTKHGRREGKKPVELDDTLRIALVDIFILSYQQRDRERERERERERRERERERDTHSMFVDPTQE
jgi:hypothetical protein